MKILSIGFTGTRMGMQMKQHNRVRETFGEVFNHPYFRPRLLTRVRHGLCVGSDVELHTIARACETFDGEVFIIGMLGPPSEWSADESIVKDCDEIRPVMPHMKRNKAIVDETCSARGVMIAAAPMDVRDFPEEGFPRYGGTFRTIGMARHAGLPLAIVFSCGTEWRERWPW